MSDTNKISKEVDSKLSKQMSSLIELLTTSGKPNLNPEIMKKFKKICRTSDEYVNHAYDLLLMQLTKNHSEIRLSTFQMIDELFNRSHAFRILILQDFETLMELTVGTDQALPIPPPKAAAKLMKTETCKSIQHWHDKFKDGYPKLVLGFEFLKANKKVDFDEIHSQMEQERQIKEENNRKLERARKDKLEKVEREMNDGKTDIELVVTEVENGLELLMPHPDNFFIGAGQSLQGEGPDEQPDNTLKPLGISKPSVVKQSTLAESENVSSYNDRIQDTNKIQLSGLVGGIGSEATTEVIATDNVTTNKTHSQDNWDQNVNGTTGKDNSDIHSQDNSDQNVNGTTGKDNSDSKNTEDDNEELEEEEEEEEEEVDYGEDMRGGVFTQEHGILSHTFEITVDVGADERVLKITDDNADIVQDVREKYKLLKTKYLNYVKRWLQVMTDCNTETADIKDMESLKIRIEEAVKKCLELDIISSVNNKSSAESDSEDDFEDVPEKEGYEEDIPEHIKLEAAVQASTSKPKRGRPKKKPRKQYWMLPDDGDDYAANDPTTAQSTLQKILEKSKKSGKSKIIPKLDPGTSSVTSSKTDTCISTSSSSGSSKGKHTSPKSSVTSSKTHMSVHTTSSSGSSKGKSPKSSEDTKNKKVQGKSKEELLEKAPVKSFGVDLEHWENPEKIEAPLQVKYEGASRFWIAEKESDETTNQDHVAALTMRTMTYTTEFEPVRWNCRAPLPDGQLCDRMDRKKCPFHGKIIPRDEIGQPTDPADIERIIKQDLKQVEEDTASTSSKGKSPVKGKGKGKAKKRKYPNLTDITVTKTSRERLESKIFKRSTLKKVNQCMDAADIKKVQEKFSNQFNYSLK